MRRLLPLLCLLLPVALYAQDGKVLLGTSFEDTAVGQTPAGWSNNAKDPNKLEIVATEAHTGKQALRLVDQSTTLDCNLRSPRVPATPGQYYSVIWWFKAEPGNTGSLYVEFWDAAGKRLTGDGVRSLGCQATGQWERHAAVVVAPGEAVSITLLPSCWSAATTEAYYDDLKLAEGQVSLIERQTMPPAQVDHPCGLYRAADLARARENVTRHQWAQDLLAGYRSAAKFWMELPDDQISFWIGEDTPMRVMDCPKCGANWDYAWKFLPPDKLECTRCKLTLPDPAYPETKSDTYLNPVGRKVALPYYQDAKGEKYRISAVLRYHRINRLDSLGSLGKVYALTGERAYAEKAVKVLRRLAEVYPGYLAHDWTTVFPDYSNLQSGKLSGWKLHDEGTFLQLATCYDLIYNSGVLTEDDKVLIENGAFRECARLLTATSPRGCCTNDGPYAMACGAALGVLLGDHDTVKWAVDHPEGFRKFIPRFFFRDGHWEDGSFSYEMMALGPLYACPEILQGYSDPPSYTGKDRYDKLDLLSDPVLRKIYVAPLRVLLPDRTGPPISDSASRAGYARRHAETNYRWYPTARNQQLLAHVFDGKFGDQGDEYALFRRDPAADLSQVKPLDLSAASTVRPGVGWAILRAGAGRDAAALYLKFGVYGSGHGHPDKLNFLYYDQGTELIPDQGYLGARHEISPWNRSTLCHNVVLVDGRAQAMQAGELLAFMPGEVVQTMVGRGEKAVPGTSRYERSLTLVNHGPGHRYVVDVVRVAGGQQHDYILHGAGQDFTTPVTGWQPFTAEVCSPPASGGKWIRTAETAPAPGPVTAQWAENGKAVRLDLLVPPATPLLHLTAPGQRNRNNPWEKRDLHLLLARRPGPTNCFTSVLQAETGAAPLQVREVKAETEQGDARAVQITGPEVDDLVAVGETASAAGWTRCGDALRFQGQQAFVGRSGGVTTLWLMNGTALQAAGVKLTCPPPLRGKVTAVDQAAGTLTVDCPGLATGEAMAGHQLLMTGLPDGAYEVTRVTAGTGTARVVHLADEPLILVKPGQEFTVTTFAEVTIRPGGQVTWRGNVPCEVEMPRQTALPGGITLISNGTAPVRAYVRPAGGTWQVWPSEAGAQGPRIRLDPAQLGRGQALIMLTDRAPDLTDHAAPRLLGLTAGATRAAQSGDLGYLHWPARLSLALQEAAPVAQSACEARLVGLTHGAQPVRLTLRQGRPGQWRVGLHASRNLPPDDYALTVTATDPWANAASFAWTFTTRGYLTPLRDAPLLENSGRVCKYLGGDFDTRFYRAEAVGDYVTFGFTVPHSGNYAVGVTHTTSESYGQWQFAVDGKPLGQPVDGYSPTNVPVGGSPGLGTAYLAAGPHRLEARVVGKHASSSGYFIGLVNLVLRPVLPSELGTKKSDHD